MSGYSNYEADALREKLAAMTKERDALQAFKVYVHTRLDDAGIPTHPDGFHSKHGCRIGDRLDIALLAGYSGES